jgi:hypothetical protein
MTRRKKPAVSREEAGGRILERPDGYYWENTAGELIGPFVTRAEAEAERLAGGASEGEFETGETLQEAESEIGMSEWIDPDTGGPAEDSVPRIEDH